MNDKHQELLSNLSNLNYYEEIGHQMYMTNHKVLDFVQLLYLNTLPPEKRNLKNLLTPRALHEQSKLQVQFKNDYGINGLSHDAFIRDNRMLEIEKLLRYVAIPSHKHQFNEFTYVISGECQHIINGQSYKNTSGSFAYLPAGNTHELIPSADCICLTIKFCTDAFLKLSLPNMPLFSYPIIFHCGDDSFICHTLLNIWEQQESNHVYSEELILLQFQSLIYYVLQNYRDQSETLYSIQTDDPIMLQILQYCYENYQYVTLKSLAAHFRLSETYLSTLIHSKLQKPFSHILREFKLKKACDLLQTTDYPLDKVCAEIGYKDTRQFIRIFKKTYKITPSKYRKQYRESNNE